MSREEDPWLGHGMSRRTLLRRGAQVAGAGYFGLALAACGGGSGSSSSSGAAGTTAGSSSAAAGSATAASTAAAQMSGQIVMMNYPGWMGKTTVADFKAALNVSVKQVSGLTSGVAASAAQLAQNKGSYDMTLGAAAMGGLCAKGNLIQTVDFSKIPNIKNIDQHLREAYPWGPPTDFGKTGFAYRKDLMSERPTSWADLWKLAPKYSGKITTLDFDTDVLGYALKYKGYSVNSGNETELNAARDALLELKPHLQAFLPTDFAKPLLQGSAVMAVDYDYDIALAQQKNPNIVWVSPEEGMPAYLDGWLAVAGTKKLEEVLAFMNFLLEPKNYAGFINTLGVSYIMPAAEPFIDKTITNNPSLRYDAAAVQTIEFEKFLGADATKLRSRIWQEVKNA